MEGLVITIPGNPLPQGRPRFHAGRTTGGGGRAYDPPKSRQEKQRIRMEVVLYMRSQRVAMLDCALCVSLQFFLPIPKSFTKNRHAAAHEGYIVPITKPDLDNLAKLVLDACNGVLFLDDRCIVDLVLSKRYSNDPRVVIMVEAIAG